eukprot:TRINITY_DN23917_c0_g1_i1.p1 TRINITY_DN23917_c0_g1~~TRINITY_DN23917_c0_g1_i1.p1  ORF type:complete len:240 (-),score=15.66 TRINITY_DN23917_c0_g1_i1:139-858(-)
MLLLPRVEDPLAQTRNPCERPTRSSHGDRPSPLKSCFHLCTNAGTDLQDKRTPRGSSSTTADGRPATTGNTPRGLNTGEKKLTWDGRSRTDPASKPLGPLSETRSTARFNGVDGISMSHAGLWLDSRAFRESCEAAGASRDNLGTVKRQTIRKKGSLSEGEKFVVKRFKDTLIRRYVSVQNGWQRLDAEQSEHISISHFVAVTAKVLKPSEARMIFRVCDTKGDGLLNVHDLITLLHDV